MAIKLIKACKELNISMKTLLDFCSTMGYNVPADPNFRIDDDVYLSLAKEFGSTTKVEQRGIQSIGADNFRKFEKLAPIHLNGITYIVGGNNAGKSTVVKALRLVVENLRTLASMGSEYSLEDIRPKFRLDIEGVNIGTFEKAHNRNSATQSISFRADLSDTITATIIVEPISAVSPIATLSFLRIEDKDVNCAFEADAKEGEMRLYNIAGTAATEDSEMRLEALKKSLDSIKMEISSYQLQLAMPIVSVEKRMEMVDKTTRLKAEQEKLEKVIKSVEADIKQRQQSAGSPTGELLFETDLSINNENPDDNLLVRYMKGMRVQLRTQNTKSQSQKSKNPVYEQNIGKMIANYRLALAASSIEYIGAHAATQKTIFSLDDHNDETVAIIHEWYQQHMHSGEEEYDFVTRWMGILGIGVGFEIKNLYGEAYAVDIKEHDGKGLSSMSELGMGAIQMMTLLLHISSLLRKYKGGRKPLVIFEEPEQNMHPNWQSHLAEIFNEVREKGFRIMVETHSEYMIRKSQVQVASMNYVNQEELNEMCPIATYYFPATSEPYKMEYRTTGGFTKPFGEGFFDEAAKWDMAIIQNEVSNPVKRVR